MKYPVAYTSATARMRRTASPSRSGGRVQPLVCLSSAADPPTTSGISVFFESVSFGMR